MIEWSLDKGLPDTVPGCDHTVTTTHVVDIEVDHFRCGVFENALGALDLGSCFETCETDQ